MTTSTNLFSLLGLCPSQLGDIPHPDLSRHFLRLTGSRDGCMPEWLMIEEVAGFFGGRSPMRQVLPSEGPWPNVEHATSWRARDSEAEGSCGAVKAFSGCSANVYSYCMFRGVWSSKRLHKRRTSYDAKLLSTFAIAISFLGALSQSRQPNSDSLKAHSQGVLEYGSKKGRNHVRTRGTNSRYKARGRQA